MLKRLFVLLLVSGGVATAHAHDFSRANDLRDLPTSVRVKIEAIRSMNLTLRPAGFSLNLRGYMQSIYRFRNTWDVNQSISVCFMGGDRMLREKIAAVANEWTLHGKVSLDFGAPPRTCDAENPSLIRISFNQRGYYSYVGLENREVPAHLPTMNFEAFDVVLPSDQRFRFLVLHEFGHALGFEHEHQSPSGGCENEFIVEKVKEIYGLTDAEFQDNMTMIRDSRAYRYSQYDPNSVMHYALDQQVLRRGTASPCYTAERGALSSVDKTGMASAYPDMTRNEILGTRYLGVIQALSAPDISAEQRSALETARRSIIQRSINDAAR